MTLTAFILGSGFAGQGHAEALRHCGVEVLGMASRTGSVVAKVAAEMDIPFATTDWEQGLAETEPDIVAIGTPGGAHFAPAMAAITQGAHVFCDKPLTPTASEAKQLYRAASEAGVKTAYAASYRYMPSVLQAKNMVARGDIGEPLEVEAISHFGLDPLIPFGWSHQLAQGGGRLNNNFPHKLAVVTSVVGGEVSAINGSCRSDLDRAPVVDGVHHFRHRHDFAPASADEPGLEWAENDADWSYTVQARIEAPGVAKPVSALFKHTGLHPRFHPDYMSFYGSEGALLIGGHYGHGPLHVLNGDGTWTEQAISDEIAKGQPDIDDDTQRNWTLLAQAFVGDIRGEAVEPYPTFRDGWLYQEMIDSIRVDNGWAYSSEWAIDA